MTTSARWHGSTLTITHRPGAPLKLAVAASLLAIPVTARFLIASELVLGWAELGGLFALGLGGLVAPTLAITRWSTLTLDARRGLSERSWTSRPTLAPRHLASLALRRDAGRVVLTATLRAGHPDPANGDTRVLLDVPAAALDEASGRALDEAVAALPFRGGAHASTANVRASNQ